MRKYLFTILVLCSCAMCAWAQKTADEYANLFNEHLNAGLQSSITMSVELPLYAYNTQVITLQDTVTGGPAGYMYLGNFITDSAQVDSATMILKEGIRKFPNRLDLYFGLATTYLYIDQPDWMINIVEEAMKQSKKNKGIWLWTGDEQVPDTIDYMFERVQEDFARFLEAEELDDAEKLARMAMKYFPKRAEYVNDLGVVYVYRNDLQKGLKYYKKALRLDPKDELIKDNIEYLEKALKSER